MICPQCGYRDSKRSKEAHGLLRIWNRILARHFGMSEEGMLEVFFQRNDLMKEEANPFTGEIMKCRISTSDLTKLQALTIMNDMDQIAVEFMGGALPYHPPGEAA